MDKEYFIELLQRYLEGKATKSELQFILSYYNLFKSEPDVLQLMNADQKQQLRDSIRQGISEKIADAKKKGRTAGIWKLTAVAAAAAVIVVVGTLVLYVDKQRPADASPSIALVRNENHVISLPDGSTVTLSSGSDLKYPSSFGSDGAREVFLTGQAFFDVHRDTTRPFVVHAGNVSVRVLGTAFNVKAISSEDNITVTVKRGKVQVSDLSKTLGVITPRERIVYNRKNEQSRQDVVDSEEYLDWKKGDCLFDNLTISEVAGLLEDRFKVKIVVDSQLMKSERFTATFSENEGLEQALVSICEFNHAKYQYDKANGFVTISKKQER